MPTWLPGVLTAAILGLVGNYVTILLTVKLQGQAMAEHARRIGIVEDVKADHALVEAELKRIDLAHGFVSGEVSQVRHRVNAIEQREIAKAAGNA